MFFLLHDQDDINLGRDLVSQNPEDPHVSPHHNLNYRHL